MNYNDILGLEISNCDMEIDLDIEFQGDVIDFTQMPENEKDFPVPEFWESAVIQAEEKVKKLQNLLGPNIIQFVWATDTHFRINHTASNNSGNPQNLGRLANRLMNDLNIPYFAITGDLLNAIGKNTIPDESIINNFFNKLVNIPKTERCLLVLGNHDGTSILSKDEWEGRYQYYEGSKEPDYKYPQLTREERFRWFMQPLWNDKSKVWGGPEYYYIDNESQQTRYIVLCGMNPEPFCFDIDENRLTKHYEDKVFRNQVYDIKQLKWLANTALKVPKNYNIILLTHFPPVIPNSTPINTDYSNSNLLFEILEAFNKKEKFKGIAHAIYLYYKKQSDGTISRDPDRREEELNFDFSNYSGEILAMFAGHHHGDGVDTRYLTTKKITKPMLFPSIRTNAAGGSAGYEVKNNSDQETSLDIVTIDTKTKDVYLTRLGVGVDRKTSCIVGDQNKLYYVDVINGVSSGYYFENEICKIYPTVPKGKKFIYWIDSVTNEKILSKNYELPITRDTVLTANFISEIGHGINLDITKIDYVLEKDENQNFIISDQMTITYRWDAPEELMLDSAQYKFKRAGILITKESYFKENKNQFLLENATYNPTFEENNINNRSPWISNPNTNFTNKGTFSWRRNYINSDGSVREKIPLLIKLYTIYENENNEEKVFYSNIYKVGKVKNDDGSEENLFDLYIEK